MKSTNMLAILVLMVCTTNLSNAAPMGTVFTYQGRLMDTNEPADGLYAFQFKLFDANAAGTQQGSTIDINDLDVIDGYFTVELDFGSGIFDGNAVWLETRVVRSPLGSEPATLSPLVELTPTPYALYAQTAGSDGDWTISGNDMYTGVGVNGNVGIGTTNPQSKLSVGGDGYATIGVYGEGNGRDSGTGVYGSGSTGVYGRGHGDDNKGVWGEGIFGVWGEGSYTGVYGIGINGVYGYGSTYGVEGRDSDTGSYGRLGYDDKGVYGNGTYGGYFAGDGYFSGDVGIGTTNPSTKLDVVGTVNATAFVGDGSGLTGIAGDSDWTESGGNVYRETGNVGIGTTNPDSKLDVVGNARINGDLTVNGNIVTTDRVAFFAFNSANDNITSPFISYKVEFDTEVYDEGGDYDNVNDRFIAPTDGIYNFCVKVELWGMGARVDVRLRKNGTYEYYLDRKHGDGTNVNQYGGAVDMKLINGDYVEIIIYSADSVYTIYGSSDSGGNYASTYFSGHRVY